MKLLTPEILSTIPQLYTQEGVEDPIARVKFFTPDGAWTWYVVEAEEQTGDVLFFGFVVGIERELGYFTLSQLENVRGSFGLRVERDLHFKPTPLSKL